MWDAIRDNKRRSWWLIALMGAILWGVGALLGRLLVGPDGAVLGIFGATAIWCALLAITYWGGERFILFSSGAREICKEDAPRLWNVVEEMTLAAGLGHMPRVYVLDSYLQNAFATGRTPESARIVVSEGLIRRLNRDELQGVVAHETRSYQKPRCSVHDDRNGHAGQRYPGFGLTPPIDVVRGRAPSRY